jgi:hypothetical protein
MSDATERAILAGGCSWGIQDLIRKRPGLIRSSATGLLLSPPDLELVLQPQLKSRFRQGHRQSVPVAGGND